MNKHFAANFFNLIIVAMIIAAGVIFWAKNQYQTNGPLAEEKVFIVQRGEGVNSIADRLQDEGFISSAVLFRLGARYNKEDTGLKFGEYEIASGSSMEGVLALLTSGVGISYQVTIPEGFSVYQVIARLNGNELLTGEVADIPKEGTLAPNTYGVSRGEDRNVVLKRMADAQVKILAQAWEGRAKNLPLKSAQEVLILASIIEKETGVNAEREEVSAVFINRLNKGMKLQTDPTVIYGITRGKASLGRGLRRSELSKKTDYNTYIIPALPPGPIANPGKAAIEAAVHPSATKSLFFVADGTGGHVFATNLRAHNANVAKWRKIEAERRKAAQKAKNNK